MKLLCLIIPVLLGCGGSHGPGPGAKGSSVSSTALPPANSPAGIEMSAFGIALQTAYESQSIGPLDTFLDPEGGVTVRGGCDTSARVLRAAAVRRWLKESLADWIVVERSGDDDHDDGLSCGSDCCSLASGLPNMCEACVATIEICLSRTSTGQRRISSIAETDTDGVICDEDEQGESPP